MCLRDVNFTDFSALRTRSIKVAERDKTQSIGMTIDFKRVFECQLCSPVWIDWQTWSFLGYGNEFWNSIGCTGR
jgi:hypothetical protein